MELVSLLISILALGISWFAYHDSAYRVGLKPYWNVFENREIYPEKAFLTIAVVNSGGRNLLLHSIGVTTAERDSTFMGNPCKRRKNITLKSFESPEVIPPKSRKEWKLLLEDSEIINDLDNSDAYIWIEDGMYNTFERAVINGNRNKKMHWTRKGAPVI